MTFPGSRGHLPEPLIRRRCLSCRWAQCRAYGKFRVNANHKLLDVWLLALCVGCGETVKLTVLERGRRTLSRQPGLGHVQMPVDGLRWTGFDHPIQLAQHPMRPVHPQSVRSDPVGEDLVQMCRRRGLDRIGVR